MPIPTLPLASRVCRRKRGHLTGCCNRSRGQAWVRCGARGTCGSRNPAGFRCSSSTSKSFHFLLLVLLLVLLLELLLLE
jgi:hypothetical protein